MSAKPSQITYVYVDGFNLYYGTLRGTRYKWLDLSKLCQSLKTESQGGVVSSELKQSIGAVSPLNLEQNRNIFLVRRGRSLGIASEIKKDLEAASGFEPLHRGFADLSLNHLGTPPLFYV